MGWYYGSNSRRELIAELTRGENNGEGWSRETLRSCTRGNVLWTVEKVSRPEGTERLIGCYLLDRYKRGEWGYKPMSESMGPSYYSCPLGYFKDVPEPPNEWGRKWREKVREENARTGRKLTVGETVKLTNGREYVVTKLRPLTGTGKADGLLYKLPRKYLAPVEVTR